MQITHNMHCTKAHSTNTSTEMVIFPDECDSQTLLGPFRVPLVLVLSMLHKKISGTNGTGWLDALHVTQPTVLKHWKTRALITTKQSICWIVLKQCAPTNLLSFWPLLLDIWPRWCGGWLPAWGFLLVFYSNHSPLMHCFWARGMGYTESGRIAATLNVFLPHGGGGHKNHSLSSSSPYITTFLKDGALLPLCNTTTLTAISCSFGLPDSRPKDIHNNLFGLAWTVCIQAICPHQRSTASGGF